MKEPNFESPTAPESLEQNGWEGKYSKYIDPKTTEEERNAIEQEMQTNGEFREYIEGSRTFALTEKYVIWRYESENAKTDTQIQPFEMSAEEIRFFFKMLDKYPEVVDQALASMSAEVRGVQAGETAENELQYLREREKLLVLRDYFTGKLSGVEKDGFHDEIIDNSLFRAMFVKIQDALK